MPKQSFWERIQPWYCPVCKHPVAANVDTCPKCGATKPGSAAAQAEDLTGQTTREYEGEKALQAGIAAMAAQGWRVVSQTSYQPRAGLGRVALLGLGALVIKPEMKFVVTFQRVTSPA